MCAHPFPIPFISPYVYFLLPSNLDNESCLYSCHFLLSSLYPVRFPAPLCIAPTSFAILQNNMTVTLLNRCLENAYKQHWDPVIFIIMMQKLSSSSERAIKSYQDTLEKIRFSNFSGEDVSRVVTLINGALKRLEGAAVNSWMITSGYSTRPFNHLLL